MCPGGVGAVYPATGRNGREGLHREYWGGVLGAASTESIRIDIHTTFIGITANVPLQAFFVEAFCCAKSIKGADS